jgi:hypothetical protein
MTRSASPKGPSTAVQMECSQCGACVAALCDCGVIYVPVGTRAANAIAKNPDKSDRAIAAELGVGKDSVRRARVPVGANAPPGKRTGRDGKQYPARHTVRTRTAKPKQSPNNVWSSDPIQENCSECEVPAEFWERSLENLAGDAISMRAHWTREFGKWESFEAPSSLVTLAKQAAQTWTELAADINSKEQIEARHAQRGNTPNAAFLLRADEACSWAKFDGKTDPRSLAAARATASAWARLVETMEQRSTFA